ncbi:hypothetical protein BDZ91DRAFT_718558 [Kalaharituber pfeilii]|nr:hypothetical protein BDZ91DRAFT_718558 [Kalaharituber pfeilii]
MERSMSKHIIVSLAIVLSLLFILLISHRLYARRQLRRHIPRSPSDPRFLTEWHIPSSTSGAAREPPLQWVNGDIIMTAPATSPVWAEGRHSFYEGGTPSVWGIDLDNARGGRRPSIQIPRPGNVYVVAAPRPPGRRESAYLGRSIAQDAEPERVDLPRYEEPPPEYEKVIEEGRGSGLGLMGEASEGSGGAGSVQIGRNMVRGEGMRVNGRAETGSVFSAGNATAENTSTAPPQSQHSGAFIPLSSGTGS